MKKTNGQKLIEWRSEIGNIRKLGFEGKNMTEIGAYYGVSGQRISQILKTFHVFGDDELWGRRLISTMNEAFQQEQRRKKWGASLCNSSDALYQKQREKLIAKRRSAYYAGYEVDIEFGDLDWPEYCPILGLKLDYFAHKMQPNSPSFDRLDPNGGYVSGNVFIISMRANNIKNNSTPEELRKIADFVEDRMKTS